MSKTKWFMLIVLGIVLLSACMPEPSCWKCTADDERTYICRWRSTNTDGGRICLDCTRPNGTSVYDCASKVTCIFSPCD